MRVAASLPRPRAIVIVSAHWQANVPTVGFADRPQTMHDFAGFAGELYDITYPASGCREAAAEVLAHLRAAGFAAESDETRGLDHGAWIPLRMMFPDADIPVIPLSLQRQAGPAAHQAIGQALAVLAAQGFLLIGSGNLTHNLGDYQGAHLNGGQVPGYVRTFADWMGRRLAAGDLPALLDYRQQAPAARRAHPSEEHLLPLYVALGAAGQSVRAERLHAGVDDHVLAMDAFAFYPGVPY